MAKDFGYSLKKADSFMDPAFSDADRLQLLQLLTRRAMLERGCRAAGGEATCIKAKENPQTESSPNIPRQWRLDPEEHLTHTVGTKSACGVGLRTVAGRYISRHCGSGDEAVRTRCGSETSERTRAGSGPSDRRADDSADVSVVRRASDPWSPAANDTG